MNWPATQAPEMHLNEKKIDYTLDEKTDSSTK